MIDIELAEIAKQICQELGIAWDENATVTTLKGKLVDAFVLHRLFAERE